MKLAKKVTSIMLAGVMAASVGSAALPAVTAYAAPPYIETAIDLTGEYVLFDSVRVEISKPITAEEGDNKISDLVYLLTPGDKIIVTMKNLDYETKDFTFVLQNDKWVGENNNILYVITESDPGSGPIVTGEENYYPAYFYTEYYTVEIRFPVNIVPMKDGWHERKFHGVDGVMREVYYYIDGEPVTEWKQIDGNWYYFDWRSGQMLYNTRTEIDGNFYSFDENGVALKGNYDLGSYSLDLSKGKVTLSASDFEPIRTTLIDYNSYSYEKSGYDVNGDGEIDIGWEWSADGKRITLFTSEFCTVNGSRTISHKNSPYSGKNYYSKLTVTFAKSGWKKESGKWRYYAAGKAVKGWREIDYEWYYFDGSGNMVTGWKKINKKWYYFCSSGEMQTGWQRISKKWYFFSESGAMQTGWKKIDSEWYYFNSSGAMQTGWKKLSGKWYYFNSDGAMRTANLKQGKKTYRFNKSGVCLNP